jgi:hypothetical protein
MFLDLPTEIQVLITEFMTPISWANLQKCCRYTRNLLTVADKERKMKDNKDLVIRNYEKWCNENCNMMWDIKSDSLKSNYCSNTLVLSEKPQIFLTELAKERLKQGDTNFSYHRFFNGETPRCENLKDYDHNWTDVKDFYKWLNEKTIENEEKGHTIYLERIPSYFWIESLILKFVYENKGYYTIIIGVAQYEDVPKAIRTSVSRIAIGSTCGKILCSKWKTLCKEHEKHEKIFLNSLAFCTFINVHTAPSVWNGFTLGESFMIWESINIFKRRSPFYSFCIFE